MESMIEKYNPFAKALFLLLLIYCLGSILFQGSAYQWDFFGYYHCAKAYFLGINPYDTGAVSAFAKQGVFPYVYPPATLYFFGLFLKLDYIHALYAYFMFKCFMLSGVIYIWSKIFFNGKVRLLFYLLCFLAFNSAIFIDFRSGNIQLVEQLLLWLAFYFFINNRITAFSISTIASAMFKIQPVFFLFLILLTDRKSKYLDLFKAFSLYGIWILFNYLIEPRLFLNFLDNSSSTLREESFINPSTFVFIKAILKSLPGFNNVHSFNSMILSALAVYFIVVVLILIASWQIFKNIKNINSSEKDKILVFFSTLVYALISIRFKDYSFMLLIPAAYYIISKSRFFIPSSIVFAVFLCLSTINPISGAAALFNLIFNHYPLIMAFIVWGLYLVEFRESPSS